jgi:hypothetical protein
VCIKVVRGPYFIIGCHHKLPMSLFHGPTRITSFPYRNKKMKVASADILIY